MNEEPIDIGPQMSGEPDPATPTVPEQIVRGLGLAPALVASESATAQLVESIRAQTDEVVERAKAKVAAEHRAERDPHFKD